MSDILKHQPSCVLLDFDGTMYSFDDVYPHVWRGLYDEYPGTLGELEFRAFYDQVGGFFASMPDGLDGDGQHDYVFGEIKRTWPGISAPAKTLISDYQRRSLEHMKPRPGLKELLSRFDEHRIPWGIVSNHDSRNRHKLEAMNLESRPAAFILSAEVGVWKPDARIFELAFEQMGDVDRSAAVIVGDNPEADIGGGRSAGMRTVLMADGPYAAADDGTADMTVTGFEELHALWFSK